MVGTAERLRASKDALLRKWAERTRAEIPPARQHAPLAIIDGLPRFVDQLVETLQRRDVEAARSARQGNLAADHGRDRAMRGDWSLVEVVREYQLFRQVVFEELDGGGERALDGRDRDLILESIDIAVRNAAEEFDRLRNQERSTRLAEAEQRFAGFVEAVKDYAIFTVDPKGFITHWNAGAERMKQYKPDEAIGHHFSMLYPEEGRRRDEPMGHLRTAAIEGRFRGEGVRLRKNGELFLADVSITPLFASSGELMGFTKVVQDLTERSMLVQERDLSRSEAERLRIEANYRERFVATLTHDLRSPLSAAKAAAGLIARKPDDEGKVRSLAHRVSDAVDRCDRMISDLLDAARLHAGEELPIQIEPCDLARIAEDAVDEMRTREGDRFRIEVQGTSEGYWCPFGMRRVLDNLLSNAVKYGARGGPITVRLRSVDDRMLLCVHNFGTIIPEEELALLFHPFHRTSDAKATGQRGWGLGLTLVRGIVEAHGGIVKAESYPKEGTTFTVDLPLDARSAARKA